MSDENEETKREDPKNRAEIAKWIIGCSGIVLLVLAITLISINGKEGSKTAFNMLVPMIGTWIGTVIAYYFSGENFQRASDSMNKMIGQVMDDKLKIIPIKEKMISRGDMVVVLLESNDDGSKVNLKTDLLDRFSDKVTRMPVLDDKGAAKCIIHQSEVFKFVTKKAAAQTTGTQFDISMLTLRDFLDFNNNEDFVSKTIAFVDIDQTLADAKAKMETIKGCQDVFVTEEGDDQKPVKGWLTNTRIAKLSKV